MKHITSLLVLIACLSSTSVSAADQILTFTGLGSVQIGMTVAEAEKALGVKLERYNPKDDDDENRWVSHIVGDISTHLSFLVSIDKIICIYFNRDLPGEPTVTTAAGIHIGSSEAELKRRYGSVLISVPVPTENDGERSGKGDSRYWMMLAKDKRTALVFSISKGKVDGLRVGTPEATAYFED